MRAGQKKEGTVRPFPSLTNNRFSGESSTIFQRYKNYVPLDYLKAELIGLNKERILNHSDLKFVLNYVDKNGEEITPVSPTGSVRAKRQTAYYKNLKFRYYPETNKLWLTGSLHTFSNHGAHNYNDFSQKAFRQTLWALYTRFGILPKHMVLYCLEWGVNIKPDVEVDLIIDHCLFHKRKEFETVYKNYRAHYVEAEHYEYILKLYNKGKQFQRGNIFRVEHKQTNYKVFADYHGYGRTLQDLLNSDFAGLKNTLLKNWKDILFTDPFLSEAFKYNKLTHTDYWKDSFKERSNKTVSKRVRKLRIINQKSGKNVQAYIAQLIDQKLNEFNPQFLTTWLQFRTLSIDRNRYPYPLPTSEQIRTKFPILSQHYFDTGHLVFLDQYNAVV